MIIVVNFNKKFHFLFKKKIQIYIFIYKITKNLFISYLLLKSKCNLYMK